MDSDNIISAPQLESVSDTFELWRNITNGSQATFYDFMTQPSVNRDSFIEKLSYSLDLYGSVTAQTIKGTKV